MRERERQRGRGTEREGDGGLARLPLPQVTPSKMLALKYTHTSQCCEVQGCAVFFFPVPHVSLLLTQVEPSELEALSPEQLVALLRGRAKVTAERAFWDSVTARLAAGLQVRWRRCSGGKVAPVRRRNGDHEGTIWVPDFRAA